MKKWIAVPLVLVLLIVVVAGPGPSPTSTTGACQPGTPAPAPLGPAPAPGPGGGLGASAFTSGQITFIQRLGADTHLDPGVIAAWAYAEENGGPAASRQASNNYNWLNIGYFDAGAGAIAFDTAFSDPTSAADQTARFLEGLWGGSSNGIRSIMATVGQPATAQISAIQGSGWATSGYPDLPGIYTSLSASLVSTLRAGMASGGGGGVPVSYTPSQSAANYIDGLGANRAGYAVVDPSGQVLQSHNERMQVPSASITKSMLLVAFLEHHSPTGAASGHLTAMIEQSSNDDANWVLAQVGTGAVTQVASQAGMTDFQLDTSDPAYHLGESKVTALDMARLFAKIDRLMPAGQRSFGMGLLGHLAPEDQWGILSANVGVIASKAGWKPEASGWVVNQAGQAQWSGQTVGLAVVSQGNASQQAGETVMQTVAQDAMSGQAGSPASCVLASAPTTPGATATIQPDGTASIPAGVPAAVQSMIQAGNKIIGMPYSWGGGHCVQAAQGPSGLGACPGQQENGGPGYDCSGSVEDLLTNGGGLIAAMALGYPASGTLESAGQSGPGQYITVFASGPHTFIEVAGIVMDTAHYASVNPTTPATGPRWQPASMIQAQLADGNQWIQRHPQGF